MSKLGIVPQERLFGCAKPAGIAPHFSILDEGEFWITSRENESKSLLNQSENLYVAMRLQRTCWAPAHVNCHMQRQGLHRPECMLWGQNMLGFPPLQSTISQTSCHKFALLGFPRIPTGDSGGPFVRGSLIRCSVRCVARGFMCPGLVTRPRGSAGEGLGMKEFCTLGSTDAGYFLVRIVQFFGANRSVFWYESFSFLYEPFSFLVRIVAPFCLWHPS